MNARQDRYERKLIQGHKLALAPIKVTEENYAMDLKKQVCDMMKNGKRLSQGEARKTFSQYLGCVLKRISTSPTSSTTSADEQDGQHIDIVVKFLQKASKYLKAPFLVKVIYCFFLMFFTFFECFT